MSQYLGITFEIGVKFLIKNPFYKTIDQQLIQKLKLKWESLGATRCKILGTPMI